MSPALISTITAVVLDEVKAWQARPLDAIYPILYLDALQVKIRDEGTVSNKAIYLALGINLEGEKELLGLWISPTEGAKFWLGILTELKNRGVQDVFIACVDGLTGFPEAIETVYPQAQVQPCIVHMVRNSLKYVSWKQRKAVADDLKTIYKAATMEEGELALDAFAETWDAQYPTISRQWRQEWEQLSVEAVYRLEEGTVIKRISPPFIAERIIYYRNQHPGAGRDEKPITLVFYYWNNRQALTLISFKSTPISKKRSGSPFILKDVLSTAVGLATYEFTGTGTVLDLPVTGDWIVRKAASTKEKMRALEGILARDLKRAVRFTQQQVEKEVIVVRGDYGFQPLVQSLEQHVVHVNPDTFYTKDRIHSTGSHASLPGLFRSIGNLMNVQFICEVDPPLEKPITYKAGLPSEMIAGNRAPYLERVLNNLTHQTGLDFAIEQRSGEVWTAMLQ